jgi:hypothetical protein
MPIFMTSNVMIRTNTEQGKRAGVEFRVQRKMKKGNAKGNAKAVRNGSVENQIKLA